MCVSLSQILFILLYIFLFFFEFALFYPWPSAWKEERFQLNKYVTLKMQKRITFFIPVFPKWINQLLRLLLLPMALMPKIVLST